MVGNDEAFNLLVSLVVVVLLRPVCTGAAEMGSRYCGEAVSQVESVLQVAGEGAEDGR